MSLVIKAYKLFKSYVEVQDAKLRLNAIKNKGAHVTFGNNIKIIGGKYITLGDNVYIGPDSRIEAWDAYLDDTFNPRIIIGNDVKINSKAHIGAINQIIIGDGVLLGSNVFITDHSHGQSTIDNMRMPPSFRKLTSKGGVKIGNNCWLCENSIILPGVTIGEGAIIGAGAVVSHDVPPFSIVVGCSATIVRTIKS